MASKCKTCGGSDIFVDPCGDGSDLLPAEDIVLDSERCEACDTRRAEPFCYYCAECDVERSA
jgi:hypothetical protein